MLQNSNWLSMLMPQEEEQGSLKAPSAGGSVASGALSGAKTGMNFGPLGAGIGAGVGGLLGVGKFLGDNNDYISRLKMFPASQMVGAAPEQAPSLAANVLAGGLGLSKFVQQNPWIMESFKKEPQEQAILEPRLHPDRQAEIANPITNGNVVQMAPQNVRAEVMAPKKQSKWAGVAKKQQDTQGKKDFMKWLGNR